MNPPVESMVVVGVFCDWCRLKAASAALAAQGLAKAGASVVPSFCIPAP